MPSHHQHQGHQDQGHQHPQGHHDHQGHHQHPGALPYRGRTQQWTGNKDTPPQAEPQHQPADNPVSTPSRAPPSPGGLSNPHPRKTLCSHSSQRPPTTAGSRVTRAWRRASRRAEASSAAPRLSRASCRGTRAEQGLLGVDAMGKGTEAPTPSQHCHGTGPSAPRPLAVASSLPGAFFGAKPSCVDRCPSCGEVGGPQKGRAGFGTEPHCPQC